jgi:hypothetical protein
MAPDGGFGVARATQNYNHLILCGSSFYDLICRPSVRHLLYIGSLYTLYAYGLLLTGCRPHQSFNFVDWVTTTPFVSIFPMVVCPHCRYCNFESHDDSFVYLQSRILTISHRQSRQKQAHYRFCYFDIYLTHNLESSFS